MNIRRLIQVSIALGLTFLPQALALAACSNPSGTSLTNPLSFCTVSDFVAGTLKVIVMIALPIIGFFIVYSGFLFVAAQGNPQKISDAKKNFLYVIIGAALVLGAWVLANLIGSTVTQLVG